MTGVQTCALPISYAPNTRRLRKRFPPPSGHALAGRPRRRTESGRGDVILSLKGRITIILTTHYMEEAEALSDRIGIMKDGGLLALGTVSELKERAGTDKFEDAFIRIVKEEIR